MHFVFKAKKQNIIFQINGIFFVNTRQKIHRNRDGFFHLCRKAQHHLTEGQHHFERSENIIVRLRHKTMLRQVANDVLRNDVGLRPMMLRFAQTD